MNISCTITLEPHCFKQFCPSQLVTVSGLMPNWNSAKVPVNERQGGDCIGWQENQLIDGTTYFINMHQDTCMMTEHSTSYIGVLHHFVWVYVSIVTHLHNTVNCQN